MSIQYRICVSKVVRSLFIKIEPSLFCGWHGPVLVLWPALVNRVTLIVVPPELSIYWLIVLDLRLFKPGLFMGLKLFTDLIKAGWHSFHDMLFGRDCVIQSNEVIFLIVRVRKLIGVYPVRCLSRFLAPRVSCHIERLFFVSYILRFKVVYFYLTERARTGWLLLWILALENLVFLQPPLSLNSPLLNCHACWHLFQWSQRCIF